jgi:hypothetical protein
MAQEKMLREEATTLIDKIKLEAMTVGLRRDTGEAKTIAIWSRAVGS